MSKHYKILLSAYACEPNKGSEAGIGWNWVLEIAKRGHNVTVITRSNNEEVIKGFFLLNKKPNNLNFVYFDLPKSILFFKKVIGVYGYYIIWQLLILNKAFLLHKKIKFDLAHHITFGSIRMNSYLWLLGVPFFLGPVAGGEHSPKALLKSMPLKNRGFENLRLFSNKLIKFNFLSRISFSATKIIFPTSQQTLELLPKKFRLKSKPSLAIGINLGDNSFFCLNRKYEDLNILYAGRLLNWKGIHLAISSYQEVNKIFNNTTFSVLGKGPYKKTLLKHAKNQSVAKKINWLDWVPHNKMSELYEKHNIFLFPSLHDSGGMVVLEALAKGLPVICLDLGGPGQIVDESCGRVILTTNKSEEDIVQDIFNAIIELQRNPDLLRQLSKGAIQRAAEFTWDKTVAKVYDPIELYMEKNNRDDKE